MNITNQTDGHIERAECKHSERRPPKQAPQSVTAASTHTCKTSPEALQISDEVHLTDLQIVNYRLINSQFRT